MEPNWIHADFNGIIGPGLLCLAHADIVKDQGGREVRLEAGMTITAFDYDAGDDGTPDNIFATGIVEPSPDYARCRGSKWALRIDSNGIRNESEVNGAEQGNEH